MNVLSKAYDILKYLLTWRKRKLYRQWVERADLPSEAVPQEAAGKDVLPKLDREQLRLPVLYMLFGAAIVVLFAGLILLVVQSC
jgi:hypothetical protein